MNVEYNYVDTLNRIDNWIARADSKISFALAFEVFLFGAIVSNKKFLVCLILIVVILV